MFCATFIDDALPDSVPAAAAMVGLVMPAVGALLYHTTGRRGGHWLRIPIVFYTVVIGSWVVYQGARQGPIDQGPPTVPFATTVWVGIPIGFGFAVAGARRWIVGSSRRRRQSAGRCGECAYDLTANASGICPECGTALQDRKSHQ